MRKPPCFSIFFLPSPLGGEGSGVRGPELAETKTPSPLTPLPRGERGIRGGPLPSGRGDKRGSAAAAAGVVVDAVPFQQGVGRLGDVVQRARPGVQVDLLGGAE